MKTLVDKFLPPIPGLNEERLASLRSSISIQLHIFTVAFLTLLLFLVFRRNVSTTEYLLFGFGLSLPVFSLAGIRLTGNDVLVRSITSVMAIGCVTVWAYLGGGLMSGAMPWLFAILAIVATFGNVAVLGSTFISVALAILFLHLAQTRGFLPESFVIPEDRPLEFLVGTLSAASATVIATLYIARERLRKNRDIASNTLRFRALTEISSDLYWERDANMRFTWVAGSLLSRTGLDPADLIGKRVWELPGALPETGEWKTYQDMLDRHESFREIILCLKDARDRQHWIAISGDPMIDASGGFAGYRGVGRDITHLHNTQQNLHDLNATLEQQVASRTAELENSVSALRDSEHLLRKLVNAIPLCIWVKDRAGRYLLVNQSHAQLRKSTPENMLGKTALQTGLSPAAAAAADRIEQEVRLTGKPREDHDDSSTDSNGNSLHFIILRLPFYFSAQDPDALLGIGINVTELKAAQLKISELNANLEKRVEQRTAELEQLTRELEAFSYSVSHDLRAPARAMTGFASVLLEDCRGQVPPGAVHMLERIEAAGTSMSRMIDSLLVLSRVGRAELNRQPVNLSDSVRKIWEELQNHRPPNSARLVVADGVVANADPGLIRSVLQNLIDNALKYTGKNPDPVIEFGSYRNGHETVYFVRDNGVGFEMEFAEKLFGAFQRLHSSDQFEGSGIGLATVQRIIHRHGGRVWCEARLNHGACFYFTLGPV
ncbi:MAG: ATP-binding protein [Burkholderiales bacterium]